MVIGLRGDPPNPGCCPPVKRLPSFFQAWHLDTLAGMGAEGKSSALRECPCAKSATAGRRSISFVAPIRGRDSGLARGTGDSSLDLFRLVFHRGDVVSWVIRLLNRRVGTIPLRWPRGH